MEEEQRTTAEEVEEERGLESQGRKKRKNNQ